MIRQRIKVNGEIAPLAVRDRGPIMRGFRAAFNTASKLAWEKTGQYFHDNLRERRFTPEHAQEAGYTARKGQLQSVGSKSFKRSYYGRKLASRYGGGPGRANPLEFTGETRRALVNGRVEATRHGARVVYPGAQRFNFRHPKSRVNMSAEFRRLTPSEVATLVDVYDRELDRILDKDS